ncbi:MAG: phage holin family protein [Burkholderiales bacterium]|nr:phage holin family protein [Burkholderiales bacterium]
MVLMRVKPDSVTETPTLVQRIRALAGTIRHLALDHVELAALEAQVAARRLGVLLSVAVMVSILVVSAWLALVAGAIVWATAAGVNWPVALALAALANLVAAGALAIWIRRQPAEPLFSATLRQLRNADPVLDEGTR